MVTIILGAILFTMTASFIRYANKMYCAVESLLTALYYVVTLWRRIRRNPAKNHTADKSTGDVRIPTVYELALISGFVMACWAVDVIKTTYASASYTFKRTTYIVSSVPYMFLRPVLSAVPIFRSFFAHVGRVISRITAFVHGIARFAYTIIAGFVGFFLAVAHEIATGEHKINNPEVFVVVQPYADDTSSDDEVDEWSRCPTPCNVPPTRVAWLDEFGRLRHSDQEPELAPAVIAFGPFPRHVACFASTWLPHADSFATIADLSQYSAAMSPLVRTPRLSIGDSVNSSVESFAGGQWASFIGFSRENEAADSVEAVAYATIAKDARSVAPFEELAPVDSANSVPANQSVWGKIKGKMTVRVNKDKKDERARPFTRIGAAFGRLTRTSSE